MIKKLIINKVHQGKLIVNKLHQNTLSIEKFKQFFTLYVKSTAYGSFDVVKRTAIRFKDMVVIEYETVSNIVSRIRLRAITSSKAKTIIDMLSHIRFKGTIKNVAITEDRANGLTAIRNMVESVTFSTFNTLNKQLFRNEIISEDISNMNMKADCSYRYGGHVIFNYVSTLESWKMVRVQDYDPFLLSELDDKEMISLGGKNPCVIMRNITTNETTITARAEGLLK